MKMITLAWWSKNKMWLAPVAALIMWSISVLCFVFGLSFKNPMGITIWNIDVSIVIASSLSLANTIIQLIGNGQDEEEMDGVFKVGWYASYVLGIASNINALLGIIGIESKILEWAVCGALGTMIEIMPEKLIIAWLKSFSPRETQTQTQNQGRTNNRGIGMSQGGFGGGGRVQQQARGVAAQSTPHQMPTPRNTPAPSWAQAGDPVRKEPTYHPVGMSAQGDNKEATYNRRAT